MNRHAPRRVMQVVLSLHPGGTERLVIEIANRLAAGVDMRVCCLDAAGEWAGELAARGVPVHLLSRRPGFDLSLGYALAQLARQHRIDVLHCHHYSPFIYGQLAACLRPCTRVVFTEHGRLTDAPASPKRKFVNALVGWLPYQIFAVSSDLREHMIAERLPAGRIAVVYNGIDPGPETTDADRVSARRALGISDRELVVGAVGRLDPVKDLGTALRALAIARAQVPSLRLVVVGDGPEAHMLRRESKRLGFGNAVTFLGYRADARALMPAFDMCVNSSHHEGVSLTVLEAMAAGLTVVATRVGGNPEVVVHGQTGLLVPARDPQALSDALSGLAHAPSSRRFMGRAGRARVVEQFSIERMVEQYRQSYLERHN